MEMQHKTRTQRRKDSRTQDKTGVPARTKIMTSIDSNYIKKGMEMLEEKGMTVEYFLDLSFKQLLIAKEIQNQRKQ